MTIDSSSPLPSEEAPHAERKYALTEGVIRSRKAETFSYHAAAISALVSTLAAIPSIFITARFVYDLPFSVSAKFGFFESLIAAIGIIAVVYIGGYFAFTRAVIGITNRRVKTFLSGDPLMARIASDYAVAEDMVRAATIRMVRNDSASSEFTHGREVIKMKIATKRDDVLGRNVAFLEVRTEEAISVTDDLIVV
jgi:hypothetical protein